MHAEVMPPAQQGLLRRLGPLAARRGFYLGGGTAVAIHLGHRRSVDLDWFTGEPLTEPLRLAAALREAGVPVAVEAVEAGTLHGEADGVRLSFLEYRYPLVHPPVEWAPFGCSLASLEDLACMKLSAVAGRGARKDFLDLYALGRRHLSLPRMLDLYQRKFQTADVGHVLFSLTYFDDAEVEAMPEMLWDLDWQDVRRTIEGWVREYAGGAS